MAVSDENSAGSSDVWLVSSMIIIEVCPISAWLIWLRLVVINMGLIIRFGNFSTAVTFFRSRLLNITSPKTILNITSPAMILRFRNIFRLQMLKLLLVLKVVLRNNPGLDCIIHRMLIARAMWTLVAIC